MPQDLREEPLANVEAEAALIGAAMLDNNQIPRLAEIVEQADFYEPLHGRIWRVMLKMNERGQLANPVTLRPAFVADPALIQLGGPMYLAQLTGSGAGLIGAQGFAEQIRDLARVRAVQHAIDRGFTLMREEGDISAFLGEVEIEVARASTTIRAVPNLSSVDLFDLTIERANKAIEEGIPGASCKTIPDIDTILGKLEGGQYTILGGRPGMGKSTTAMSACIGYALDGNACQYFLCESSAVMFSLKYSADLLHAAGRAIRFKTLKEGLLSRAERLDLEKVREFAKGLPIKFAHIGRADVRKVEAMVAREVARLAKQGRKLKVVFIDYLQLLDAEGRYRKGDDTKKVNAISEALLGIAQTHDLHVVALSQLTRSVEQREDKRPRLSDLRESGRLEEDADNVMFVYRPEYYLQNEKPNDPKKLEDWNVDLAKWEGKVELIAAKTRFGSNASRKCNFLGDFSAVRGSAWSDEAGEPDLFGQDDDDEQTVDWQSPVGGGTR